MPFTLSPASLSDIPTLSTIFQDAFESDPHTRFKSFDKPPNHQAEIMRPAIEMWIKSSKAKVVKAVDEGSGAVLGWCCWGWNEGNGSEVREGEKEGEKERAPEPESESSQRARIESDPEPQDPRTKLEALTNAHITRWTQKIMPPSPSSSCIYIICLAISPRYQSQGIGSLLLSHVLQKADERDVFCWVQSSMHGYRVFEKAGFREVDGESLRLCLDEFVPVGGEGRGAEGNGGWGWYVWRCMVRERKSKREGGGG